MKKSVQLGGKDGFELELSVTLSGTQISEASLQVLGGPELLLLASEWREKLSGELSEIEVPEGHGMAQMVLREAILKLQDNWNYPYAEEELCHCRAILTKSVDDAILHGAHTPEKVSQLTSASTSCGSCREDVVEIIKYRMS